MVTAPPPLRDPRDQLIFFTIVGAGIIAYFLDQKILAVLLIPIGVALYLFYLFAERLC